MFNLISVVAPLLKIIFRTKVGFTSLLFSVLALIFGANEDTLMSILSTDFNKVDNGFLIFLNLILYTIKNYYSYFNKFFYFIIFLLFNFFIFLGYKLFQKEKKVVLKDKIEILKDKIEVAKLDIELKNLIDEENKVENNDSKI